MFLSAMLGRHGSLATNTNSIMAAFTTLDADGDGYITRADLQATLHGQHVSESALAEMLSAECAIADAEGRVSYQAFRRMMLRGLRNSISAGTPPEGSGGLLAGPDGRLRVSGCGEAKDADAGLTNVSLEVEKAVHVTRALRNSIIMRPEVGLGALEV